MTRTPAPTDDAPPSAFDGDDLGQFVRGYVDCLHFFETLPPPDDSEGEDWMYGYSYDEAGFEYRCLTAKSLAKVTAHCRKFLELGADLIPGNRRHFEGTEMSHAGHYAAMSCQGFEDGFSDGRWQPHAGRKLSEIAEGIGGFDIEPSRGRVHVF